MKGLILSSLIALSGQTMALTCTSELSSETTLTLDQKGGALVLAYYNSPELQIVFAGKSNGNPFLKSYQLVDQNSEITNFSLNNQLAFGQFCRTRVCPPTPTMPTLVGKLTHPSGEDEYFKCL